MIIIAIASVFAFLSFACFVLKAFVVWSVDHDVYNGGGVPTLDFPLIYPLFIAFPVSVALHSANLYPFPFFGFAFWAALTAFAFIFMWYSNRHGSPERQRQLDRISRDETE